DSLAIETHGRNHVVQQLAGTPDKRDALHIFIRTGTFADEQQLGVWIAIAEDDFVAPFKGELAAGAISNFLADDFERCGAGLGCDGWRGKVDDCGSYKKAGFWRHDGRRIGYSGIGC